MAGSSAGVLTSPRAADRRGTAGRKTHIIVDKIPCARRVRAAKAAAEREANCSVVRSRLRVNVTSPQTSVRPLMSRARSRMD